jgi:hypothetical protein
VCDAMRQKRDESKGPAGRYDETSTGSVRSRSIHSAKSGSTIA